MRQRRKVCGYSNYLACTCRLRSASRRKKFRTSCRDRWAHLHHCCSAPGCGKSIWLYEFWRTKLALREAASCRRHNYDWLLSSSSVSHLLHVRTSWAEAACIEFYILWDILKLGVFDLPETILFKRINYKNLPSLSSLYNKWPVEYQKKFRNNHTSTLNKDV